MIGDSYGENRVEGIVESEIECSENIKVVKLIYTISIFPINNIFSSKDFLIIVLIIETDY